MLHHHHLPLSNVFENFGQLVVHNLKPAHIRNLTRWGRRITMTGPGVYLYPRQFTSSRAAEHPASKSLSDDALATPRPPAAGPGSPVPATPGRDSELSEDVVA